MVRRIGVRVTGLVVATGLVLVGAGTGGAHAPVALEGGSEWGGLPSRQAQSAFLRTGDSRSSLALLAARPPKGRGSRPLTGSTVVLDPGHQLGNRRFPSQINEHVQVGGFSKPCNTTGTATNGGYPEATFNWQVARQVRKRLRKLGARVVMTRKVNRSDRWGPCVDVRGRAGNARPRADLKVSIHADGSHRSGARGFHVIVKPGAPASRRLANQMRRSLRGVLPTANYIARDGISVRSDLGTLNLSRIPTVMVEAGNMRHPTDARLMTTAKGRASYAKAIVRGIRRHLR